MTSGPMDLGNISPPAASPSSLTAKLGLFASDIKVQHTVFALPWALLSAVLAGRAPGASLTAAKIGLILICMVAARTAAMAANRLFDAELDSKNPRTQKRAIPSGKLSRGFFAAALGICWVAFIAAVAMFEILYRNPWPIILSVPVLVYLCAYPFWKRFSLLCHYYLGAALGLAPLCAWAAIAGRITWPPIIMFAAVTTWTAGFDIIYACQDYESDLATGIHSVPAKLGIGNALWMSRGTHLISAGMIVLLACVVPQFGHFFAIGAGIAVLLLIVEQSLVKANDLSKANLAFFTINGVISVLLGTLGILDILLH